ncbi:hypothetical protein B0H66DRAFT_387398 [Apodospora peruviana]|uniref:Domain of unknown function at the cortex 1 domain-containing protein n=1 Tax=Apodospora peruviana TaxID=516989 RepID=A0AAE0HUJ1_9PEZI|nr:hypothetical protein B0H66DRAFT_387398 [Apodospora peruviana]
MTDKYVMRVTAGSTYDLDKHVQVPINTAEPVKISSNLMDIELSVRVQGYKGLPPNSPTTSPYFDHEPHAYNKDQYSIAFRFTPKKEGHVSAKKEAAAAGSTRSSSSSTTSSDQDDDEEEVEGISALDLQFGNDFDHPIRDRLPPGFNTAMNIVKWWIDPGLDGDAYADVPHLYGPALSSFNAVHVGSGMHDEAKGGLWFEEGGDDEGLAKRKEIGAPEDAKQRMKWALKEDSKKRWVWEFGRTYGVDFFNPYIDFGEFSLRLPGFHLPIMKYWDGQGLRYVLRNRSTNQPYLVILFTLYLKEDVNEDGSLKPSALQATAIASGGGAKGKGEPIDLHHDEHFDEEKALDEARRKLSGVSVGDGNPFDNTNEDDVD